jgi:alcohol dehydrogenase class IV
MKFSLMTLSNVLISGKVGAGYTNEAGQKTVVSSPYLAPSGVILDAELSLVTPENLW